jgi:hypothetical protein
MFRRKKQQDVDGDVCPYCEFVNPEGVAQCAQCYYVMDKSARDQPMATPTSSGSELMATLMGDEEFEEEEAFAVEAVLSMEEVTVEIGQGQLGDAGDEDSLGFIKAGNPTLSETVEYESPETVELETSDAPSTPVDFQIEAHDPMSEVAEPVHTGLGNLYSPMVKTESDDDLMGSVGPALGFPSSTPDLPDLPGESPVDAVALPITQAIAAAPEPAPAPTSTPELPDAMDSVTPVHVETPQIPDLPEATPELPEASEPETVTPEVPDEAPVTPAPEPQHNGRIWPWPAQEPWDPRQVYREVVAVLEAIKSGRLPEAAQILDVLGPHLEHNLDMLLHIGASMRQLGREEHLQWTLAMAQHVHPNDEQVAAAVAQLGSGA